jgi:group II intron reverse transcriptase/maturase
LNNKKRWYSLYDKVYSATNLKKAWDKVRSNKGSGGIDGVSIQQFRQEEDKNLSEINRLLKEKRYEPKELKRVYIPKSKTEQRSLGIPTIRDRIVQQALLNILNPVFEVKFHNDSYGFRPLRSAHQAVKEVNRSIKEDKYWIVEVDIRKYFDTVNHDLLLEKINEEISDGSILKLIKQFLKSGVMEEGIKVRTEAGTPQGGVISPLLANIYLDELDWQMSMEGYKVVRYADDLVVMCKSKEEAEKAYERIKAIIEDRLKLKIHEGKMRILNHKEEPFEFLGFQFHWKYVLIRKKSIQKFRDRVREVTRRQQPRNVKEVIQRLNYVLRGFANYFKIGNVKYTLRDLDGWVRMRIRCFIEKRKRMHYQSFKYGNALLKSYGLISMMEIKINYESSL